MKANVDIPVLVVCGQCGTELAANVTIYNGCLLASAYPCEVCLKRAGDRGYIDGRGDKARLDDDGSEM